MSRSISCLYAIIILVVIDSFFLDYAHDVSSLVSRHVICWRHSLFATLIVRVTLISRFFLYHEIREVNVSRR